MEAVCIECVSIAMHKIKERGISSNVAPFIVETACKYLSIYACIANLYISSYLFSVYHLISHSTVEKLPALYFKKTCFEAVVASYDI